MNHGSKACALVLAVLCCTTLLTGCKKQNVMTEDELPYGATMRSTSAYAVPLTYDRRFLEEPQVETIASFLGALENSDGTVLEQTTFPEYFAYELGEVYAENCKNADEVAAAKHDALAETYGNGGQLHFKEVELTGLTQEQQQSGIAALLTMLYQLSDDEHLAEKIDNTWCVTMDWTVEGAESTELVQERTLYLLEEDGVYYCIM